MEIKDSLNISQIESFLYGIIDGRVSQNTFVGTLPSNMDATWSDMVLIDCDGALMDYDAYGVGIVRIGLYAKPLTSGSKNVSILSRMENTLNEIIRNNDNKTYKINRKSAYADYDNDRNWHYNVINLTIKIY